MKKRALAKKNSFSANKRSKKQRTAIKDLLFKFVELMPNFYCPECNNEVKLEVCGKGGDICLRCPECRTFTKKLNTFEMHRLREVIARDRHGDFENKQAEAKKLKEGRPIEYLTEEDWRELMKKS